jgi:DNA modification methylase
MNGFVNEIILGNCENVLKECPNNSIQLVFTSPPYADISGKYLDGYSGPPPKKYNQWLIPKVREFYRVLKDDGSFILNIDSKVEDGFESTYVYELVTGIVKETGFKLFDSLFWDKGKFLPIRNRFGNRAEFLFFFVKQRDFKFNIDAFRNEYSPISIARMKNPIKKRFARTEENQKLDNYKPWSPNPKGALPGNIIECGSESQRVCDNHIACFPIKLTEKFILGCTAPGDIVLDPFCGVGSTLCGAKKHGRNYLGIDIFENYCNFSRERLKKIETVVS